MSWVPPALMRAQLTTTSRVPPPPPYLQNGQHPPLAAARVAAAAAFVENSPRIRAANPSSLAFILCVLSII